MAIGDYWDIPRDRQREIIKIAHRKRRTFSPWQRQQIAIWRKAEQRNQQLPEQQLFFMRDVESALVFRGLLDKET